MSTTYRVKNGGKIYTGIRAERLHYYCAGDSDLPGYMAALTSAQERIAWAGDDPEEIAIAAEGAAVDQITVEVE